MFNRSASLAMSTSILKALPGKPDIKRHSPSIFYLFFAIFSVIKYAKQKKEKKENSEKVIGNDEDG